MVDLLYLEPLKGEFDTDDIEAYLQNLPFTFQDPVNPEIYLICGDKGSEKYCQNKRRNEPEADYPYVCLVAVASTRIDIRQICQEDELIQCREFVEWMLDQYECRITDDYGNDWTARCKNSVDILYSD